MSIKILGADEIAEAAVDAIRDVTEELKTLNQTLAQIAEFLKQERDASQELSAHIRSKGV